MIKPIINEYIKPKKENISNVIGTENIGEANFLDIEIAISSCSEVKFGLLFSIICLVCDKISSKYSWS